MGMVTYYAGRVLAIAGLGLLTVAVMWEANHMIEWARTLWEAHGDGSVASYLRYHAYTYVTWLFGTDFGWTL